MKKDKHEESMNLRKLIVGLIILVVLLGLVISLLADKNFNQSKEISSLNDSVNKLFNQENKTIICPLGNGTIDFNTTYLVINSKEYAILRCS